MVLLKVHKLAVNKESISFQTDRKLVDLWLSITKSYFKNNGFDVTDIKLISKDIYQQFKANQKNGIENSILNFYSTGKIVINSKCLEELLVSRISGLENLYEITFKIKGANSIKSKDTSTTTVKESTTKTLIMMKIIPARLIPKLTKNPPKHLQMHLQENLKSHNLRNQRLKKRVLQDIVTSQSRQQSIFNNKTESEQTRLTEELNQLQIHMQSLKHNMKDDEIKQEFELLIRKEVATHKESLLETFENKQKKLQKEIDTLKKENSELRIHIENITCSKQQKDISNNQRKENNEIQLSLKSVTETEELSVTDHLLQIRLKTLKVH